MSANMRHVFVTVGENPDDHRSLRGRKTFSSALRRPTIEQIYPLLGPYKNEKISDWIDTLLHTPLLAVYHCHHFDSFYLLLITPFTLGLQELRICCNIYGEGNNIWRNRCNLNITLNSMICSHRAVCHIIVHYRWRIF